MIEQITFKKEAEHNASYNYINKLTGIEALNHSISFKPGLNIIVGPNGSGKSSILNAIGHHLGASHSGYSALTKKWLQSISFKEENEQQIPISAITLKHDGQPIIFGDPRRTLGLSASGIDQELYGHGLLEHMEMSRESSGEQSNRRITPFLQILQGHDNFPENFSDYIDLMNCNNQTKSKFIGLQKHWLQGNIDKGQPTVLLDEPETGLGMMNQILLWQRIIQSKEVTDKFQIILVSHSNQCLNLPNANYIELRPGYLAACQQLADGTMDFKEAARFASNLPHKLNKRELSVLRKIRASVDNFCTIKSPKTCERLEDLDLIQGYRKRIEQKPGDRKFNSFRSRYEYGYKVTEKGLQLLDIQLTDED